jgi:hypothetical protein
VPRLCNNVRLGSQHRECIASGSGREWLPAFFSTATGGRPVWEGFGIEHCLDIWHRPDATIVGHTKSEKPIQPSPLLDCARRRRLPRRSLSRLDAGGCFELGARRSRRAGKSIYQAGPIAPGYTHRHPASGASVNPQGMVPSCHEWTASLANPARSAGSHLRDNRRGLSGLSHRLSPAVIRGAVRAVPPSL